MVDHAFGTTSLVGRCWIQTRLWLRCRHRFRRRLQRVFEHDGLELRFVSWRVLGAAIIIVDNVRVHVVSDDRREWRERFIEVSLGFSEANEIFKLPVELPYLSPHN